MSHKKVILIQCPTHAQLVESILSPTLYEFHHFEEFQELEEKPSVDFTFLESMEELPKALGDVVLFCAPGDYQKSFEGKVKAVVWPKTLEHEVGQTLLRRLLGENSSLGIESVYSRSEVDFKSFRFMDHLSMGHYADILAQSADKSGFPPLSIRTFFDTTAGLLASLESKISLPYDVDFGVWNDVYVIQIHASAQDLVVEDFLKSMSDYTVVNPKQGLLKQALSQVDALDIFTLERSERVVLTAQWFHPSFKAQSVGYPSLFLHQIPSFEELRPSYGHNTLKTPEKSAWTKEASPNEAYEQVINKVKGMDFSDFYQMVYGKGEDEDLDIEKVKAALGVTDDDILVQGKVEEDESFSRVKGSPEDLTEDAHHVDGEGAADASENSSVVKGQKEDLGEDFQSIKGEKEDLTLDRQKVAGEKEDLGEKAQEKQVISGSELKKRAEELWKIKRDEVIDNIKDKQVVSGEEPSSNLLPDEEVSQVVKDHLNLKDEEVSFVVQDLLSNESSSNQEKQRVHSLEDQLKDQEIIKRDAQIQRMRKLMERMKKELIEKSNQPDTDSLEQREARQEERDEQTKERKIESLTKELERQKAAQRQVRDSLQAQLDAKEERLEKILGENEELRQSQDKAQHVQSDDELLELKNKNDTLENQLEVARKRISQMSERMLNTSRDTKEREESELNKLKELGANTQKTITQMQTKLARAEKQLLEKENENASLLKRIESLETVDGPKKEQVETQHLNDEIERLKAENKKNAEKEKDLSLELKKVEQKNRFLQAQLDAAQKKTAGQSGAAGASGNGPTDKKIKQYERIIEVMKENETRVHDDLIEKKDQAQKLKAEGMALKNKVAELERKLQKYEKSAA